jgi:carbamoyltransferase
LAHAFGGGGLALGPSYSESDVKLTLDNARLDYLYEPHWPRLLDRVSRLLGRGKLVAWHHGPTEFGFPYRGSRCVLCDPAQRFARENVNRFFRHVPVEAPVLLVTTEALAGAFTPSPVTPWAPARVAATAEARERLRGGLEPSGAGQVFVAPAGAGSRLAELVERHHERTGVPALISVPLDGQGDATACAPRDAVRATFSSAVDALAIERFLLMKDYWLLRSDEGTAG